MTKTNYSITKLTNFPKCSELNVREMEGGRGRERERKRENT